MNATTSRMSKLHHEVCIERMQTGLQPPTTVYIGRNEAREVDEAIRTLCVFKNSGPAQERATFQGLEIYRVDADDHLEIA